MKLRDFSQELKELGLRGAAFRTSWEIQGRIGLRRIDVDASIDMRPYVDHAGIRDLTWPRHLPFCDATSVAEAMNPVLSSSDLNTLRDRATAALDGNIVCFSNQVRSFGSPIDWHLQPETGAHWDHTKDITFAIGGDSPEGDVKRTWELGRFPHAYLVSRASAFYPEDLDRLSNRLLRQIEEFQRQNPFGLGVHWTSGQEISFRLLAWLFALNVMFSRTADAKRATELIAAAMVTGASWIEAHLDYSRIAVYNNHVLSEALALFGVGALLPLSQGGPHWRKLGRDILDQECERQFYKDGGYIQQSHNYHRVALQDLLWACAFARAMGDRPSPIWMAAMERSLDFLVFQQNPVSGDLPNYGANDGSHPSVLSSCDFKDMRPVLQSVSLLVRNERLYDHGSWDEEATWWLGRQAVDAPKRNLTRRSVSFEGSGYHVLRGNDEQSFATFRCGSLRDRFSQIDMLHLDVWWRGMNVLVDGGSYQYNGAHEWHNHFTRTGSHNTIVVDDHDQMVHFRQFKVLYWTQAELLRFADAPAWAVVEGEHYGYRRHPGECVHRRSVLYLKDDLWIVADSVLGTGSHAARLHWLGGEFDWSPADRGNGFDLATPRGKFTVRILDTAGARQTGDVVAGQEHPPRGWLSRYYAHKAAVPSSVTTQSSTAPITFVSILAGTDYECSVENALWKITVAGKTTRFTLPDGRFTQVNVA